MSINTIGYVGLGVMGEAMCRNIARKGSWNVVGYDRVAAPMERLKADGVSGAASPADVVARCDVVLMCLPGEPRSRRSAAARTGSSASSAPARR